MNIHEPKDMHKNIYSNIICDSPKLEDPNVHQK